MIKVDISHAHLHEDIFLYQDKIDAIHQMLWNKTGKGSSFTGWMDWVHRMDQNEFRKIQLCGEKIAKTCDVCIVCGVGGSYLGSRAAIEMLKKTYGNSEPEIIFLGYTFSAIHTRKVLKYIEGKSVCVNVISKSGSTTETAIAFRFLKKYMEDTYGKEEARKRIFVTTDASCGLMRQIVEKEGYESFVIPDDIGGRYSVITPVGLLPMAIVGIDIERVMNGLKQAYDDMTSSDLHQNHAYRYAIARHLLQKQGYDVEMLVTYDPCMKMVEEWWKQLFAESEGKDEKGILPCSASFSTDLHSVGQFIQQGKKVLFESLLYVDSFEADLEIPYIENDLDGLNYLAGKSLNWVNEMSYKGTLKAHVETGNVPNILISLPNISEESFGYMCYFFFRACAMSCYLLDINPFDQPGVEIYKTNMFQLLNKPGYENKS